MQSPFSSQSITNICVACESIGTVSDMDLMQGLSNIISKNISSFKVDIELIPSFMSLYNILSKKSIDSVFNSLFIQNVYEALTNWINMQNGMQSSRSIKPTSVLIALEKFLKIDLKTLTLITKDDVATHSYNKKNKNYVIIQFHYNLLKNLNNYIQKIPINVLENVVRGISLKNTYLAFKEHNFTTGADKIGGFSRSTMNQKQIHQRLFSATTIMDIVKICFDKQERLNNIDSINLSTALYLIVKKIQEERVDENATKEYSSMSTESIKQNSCEIEIESNIKRTCEVKWYVYHLLYELSQRGDVPQRWATRNLWCVAKLNLNYDIEELRVSENKSTFFFVLNKDIVKIMNSFTSQIECHRNENSDLISNILWAMAAMQHTNILFFKVFFTLMMHNSRIINYIIF